jgi:hypothetical protein
MTRTITLPIKCSTVKKTNAILVSIYTWEILICCITGTLWAISMWYYATIKFDNILVHNTTVVPPSVLILLLGASCFLIGFPMIAWGLFKDRFPTIECVKDEGDEKQ